MGEAEGDYRQEALAEWNLATADYPCVVCSRASRWALHHYDYLSRGGPREDPNNLVPLCQWDHEYVHLEKFRLVWVDGIVSTLDQVTGKLVSRTPWPPNKDVMTVVGIAAQEAKKQLTIIEGHSHAMIATQIPPTIQSIDEIKQYTERVILHLAHERMERAPRLHKTKVAEALAAELKEAGMPISSTMVRSLANQFEVMQEVGEEKFDNTPKMIRMLSSWTDTPEEGAAIIEAYHERPEGQSARAFVAAHYTQATIGGKDTLVNLCDKCGGRGQIDCDACDGEGLKSDDSKASDMKESG